MKSSALFHKCFFPGEVLTKYGAQVFGQVGPEAPIFLDYISETNGMPLPVGGGPEPDWWDDGRRDDYIRTLSLRHGIPESTLKADSLIKDKLRQPDILTFNGYYVNGGKGRCEFYEIKPGSVTGKTAGEEKIALLKKTYKKYRLPYKPGETYPRKREKELFLLGNNQCKYLFKIIAKNFRISGLKVFIRVQRERSGLLLYTICIEFNDDGGLDETLGTLVAKYIYSTYVISHIKSIEETKKVKSELISSVQVRGATVPPVIKVAYNELAPEIEFLKQWISAQLYSRGLGIPGDQFALCCDRQFFNSIVLRPEIAKRTIDSLQINVRSLFPLAQISLAIGLTGAAVAGVVVDAAWFVLEEIGFSDLAKKVARFVEERPLLSIVLVVAVLAVSAALIKELGIAAALGVASTSGEVGSETLLASEVVNAAMGVQASQMALEAGAADAMLAAEAGGLGGATVGSGGWAPVP